MKKSLVSILRPVVFLAILLLAATSHADVTLRYFRFTQVKLRTTAATSIQLSEFEIQFNETRIQGAIVTNPGGNNPGAELPPNVYDGLTTSKWLDRNKGALIFDFGTPVTANGYRLATANDRDERDPVSWVLEGSDDLANWTLLDAKTDYATPLARFTYTPTLTFSSDVPPIITAFVGSPAVILPGGTMNLNWTTVNAAMVSISPAVGSVPVNGSFAVSPTADTTYTLTAENPFGTVTAQFFARVRSQKTVTWRFFRFETTKQRGGPQALQLAEFDMLLDGVRQPGATASNPGGVSPLNEEVFRVVDGLVETKWLDQNHGSLILDYGVPIAVNGYRFTTANDSAPRDPVSWNMYGSDDGVVWTKFDTLDDYPVTSTRLTPIDTIPIPDITFPPVISAFTASSEMVQAGQAVVFSWTIAGADSANITDIGDVAADTGVTAIRPTATGTYTLTATNAGGSVTANVTVAVGYIGGVTYQYFRFTPKKLRDNAAANSVQLSEFGMFLGNTRLSGATATNPGGNNPQLEQPSNAVDGNTSTKWLDFNKGALVLDYGVPVVTDGYSFATAGDATERDPVSWTVQGSLDGTAWTLIDAKGDYATQFERDTFLPFTVPTLASAPVPQGEYRITVFEVTADLSQARIRWNSEPGSVYSVQRATDLTTGGTGDWQALIADFFTEDTRAEVVLPTGGGPKTYFRVVLQ